MIVFEVLMEVLHAFVDLFVRPCKIVLVRPVEFYRLDNNYPYVVKDVKPLGYWVGHVLAYLVAIGGIISGSS